jgi:hypothetical protein
MNHIISDESMTEMHDLIAEIDHNAFKLERDIRNLYNLIHVIKGDGVRLAEFRSGNHE